MARFSAKIVSDLIDDAQVATDNAQQQTDIAQAFTAVNFTAAQLQEGVGLLNSLKTVNEAWLKAQAQQKEATAVFKAQWKSVTTLYKQQAKLASALLATRPELLPRLGLEGGRLRTYTGLLGQMRQFYAEAQGDTALTALLAAGGLTLPLLQANQTALETAVTRNSDQEDAKSRAQAATQTRDAAAAALSAWLKTFWQMAKFALRDNPQRLEALSKKA